MFLFITKIILTRNMPNNLISILWMPLFLVISSMWIPTLNLVPGTPHSLTSHRVFLFEVSLSFPHVSIRFCSFIYPTACHSLSYFRAWYAVVFLPHIGITTLNSLTILCFSSFKKAHNPTTVEWMNLRMSKSIHIYWMNTCWRNKWMDASYLDHI